MFNKKNSLVKFLILSLIALMLVPNAVSRTVNAEEEEPGIVTVKEGGTAINSEDDFTKLTLTTTTVVTNPELQTYSGDFLNVGNKGLNLEKAAEGEDPIIYTITYPAELNYFNIPVTVQLQAEVISEGEVSSGSWIKLWIDGATGLVKLGMKGRYGATIRWTITLLDPEDNSFFPVDVVFGFKDPDESHYLFDTTQRDIYYLSLDGIAEYYELANDGLYRLSKRGGPDRYTSKSPAPDFNNSNCFYMDMKGTFTFDTFTFTQGAYVVPYFYSRKYNITYDLNDDDGGPKATPAKDNPTEYAVSGDPVEIPNEPSRPGYKFVGWTREDGSDNQVDPWESGDKEFVAQWEPLPYKILYDPNVPEGEKVNGEMEPDNYTGADSTMPSKEEWTYSRDYYELVGYTYEDPDSEDIKKLQADEYRPELLGDDNGEITLYAQWEPWPYHIAYDANGGEGHIPTQDFVYEKEPEDPWNSETNNDRFTRKGYKFIGFKYQDENGEWSDLIPPTGVEDFYDYLVNVLKIKDSTVTLYAQWQKNPVAPYALPVTGIDRH